MNNKREHKTVLIPIRSMLGISGFKVMPPGRGKFHQDILLSGLKIKNIVGAVQDLNPGC